jgi:hypothetical protein
MFKLLRGTAYVASSVAFSSGHEAVVPAKENLSSCYPRGCAHLYLTENWEPGTEN